MRDRNSNREVQFKRLQPVYDDNLETMRQRYSSWFDTAPPEYQRAALAVQAWLGTNQKTGNDTSCSI
jgi:hypothetical protein